MARQTSIVAVLVVLACIYGAQAQKVNLDVAGSVFNGVKALSGSSRSEGKGATLLLPKAQDVA